MLPALSPIPLRGTLLTSLGWVTREPGLWRHVGTLQHVLLAFLLLWTPCSAALGIEAALVRAELAERDSDSTMDPISQQIPCQSLAVHGTGDSLMPRGTNAGSVQVWEQLMGEGGI